MPRISSGRALYPRCGVLASSSAPRRTDNSHQHGSAGRKALKARPFGSFWKLLRKIHDDWLPAAAGGTSIQVRRRSAAPTHRNLPVPSNSGAGRHLWNCPNRSAGVAERGDLRKQGASCTALWMPLLHFGLMSTAIRTACLSVSSLMTLQFAAKELARC